MKQNQYKHKISLWILFSLYFTPLYTEFYTNVYADELKFNTQDFPPFHYLEEKDGISNGKIAGPAVELIQQVCQDANMSCSLRLLPWTRAQKEVEKGDAHALFLIGWNEEREKLLYFSYPIVQTAYGFFVHTDNNLNYHNPSDITGYTIGVFGPSNTSKSLEEIKDKMLKSGIPPFTIDVRPNDEAGFRKLNMQRVQAVYSNREVGNAMVAKLGLKNIRYAGDHKYLKYYIGFSKKYVNKSVVDKFNESFKKMHQAGKVSEILAKYKMEVLPEKDWNN